MWFRRWLHRLLSRFGLRVSYVEKTVSGVKVTIS
jgi:hypothetical protein